MAVGSRVAPTPVLSIICSASSAVILKVTDSACQLLCQCPFEQEDVIKPRSPAVLFSDQKMMHQWLLFFWNYKHFRL